MTCPSVHTCRHIHEYAIVHAYMYTSARYMLAGPLESSREFMRVWYVLNILDAVYTTTYIYYIYVNTYNNTYTCQCTSMSMCGTCVHTPICHSECSNISSMDHVALRVIYPSCVCMSLCNKYSMPVDISKCRCEYNAFKRSINLTE